MRAGEVRPETQGAAWGCIHVRRTGDDKGLVSQSGWVAWREKAYRAVRPRTTETFLATIVGAGFAVYWAVVLVDEGYAGGVGECGRHGVYRAIRRRFGENGGARGDKDKKEGGDGEREARGEVVVRRKERGGERRGRR